ncbi:hypothetical protein BDZ45DRAFT_668302 [Acephala macrosclerotiorum]|nr:hypothetical protein BDZ45DRAFT_668302 [Acephala macrosclerotiorum]
MTDNKSSKESKDLAFIVAMIKSGNLTFNYDEAATLLNCTKLQCRQKMCQFRKDYDWPVDKNAPKAAAKSPKPKGTKRAAVDGEVKKPAAKRAKANKKDSKVDNEGKDEEALVAEEEVQNFDEGADEY